MCIFITFYLANIGKKSYLLYRDAGCQTSEKNFDTLSSTESEIQTEGPTPLRKYKMFPYYNPFGGYHPYNPYYQRDTWIEVIRDYARFNTHKASVKRKRS